MILFNVGYNRGQKEPFVLTIHGMDYNVETHEDVATLSLADLDRLIKSLVDTREHYMRGLN